MWKFPETPWMLRISLVAFAGALALSGFIATGPRAAEPEKIPPHNRFDGRFRVRANGAVVDEVRRLVWSRCSHGQIYNGITCAGRPQPLSFSKARRHCAGLAGAPGEVWRLPVLAELESLSDPGRVSGAKIDPLWFPATDPYGYWTRTHTSEPQGLFWSVYDFGAARRFAVQGGRYHVRCVTEWYGT